MGIRTSVRKGITDCHGRRSRPRNDIRFSVVIPRSEATWESVTLCDVGIRNLYRINFKENYYGKHIFDT